MRQRKTLCWKFETILGNVTKLIAKERKPVLFQSTDAGLENSQLPGPSVRSPKQMITALENGRRVLLIPHVDTQGQVQGSSDDTVWILERKSSELQPWVPNSSKHVPEGRCHTHHPHRRDGPLVVLEGHQLQAVNVEQHQL